MGPFRSEGSPSARPNVVKVASLSRSIPQGPPHHRFPSRSSNRVFTGPTLSGSPSDETPVALKRSNPVLVPIHKLEWRSINIASDEDRLKEGGIPSAVSSVPFQRTMPASVPTHTF